MTSTPRALLVPILAVLAGLVQLTAQPRAGQKEILVSKKVSAAPRLDGTMKDLWKEARPLTVRAAGGRNFPAGATAVTLRSLHTNGMVYFLIQWKDETHSARRNPWQKQPDGSWKQLKDPHSAGEDDNVYYEDKMAIIWNISSPEFATKGCLSVCHVGEGKPYGNKYTRNTGERLDMWHWKSVRTGPVDQIDDQYVDDTRYDEQKSPQAGRHGDPNTGGGYVANDTAEGTRPKFALPGNKPAPPYWILDREKEDLDDSKYKVGDEVPGVVVAPFKGDRGDVAAHGSWKDGVWTVELARRLTTGSEFDVQFDQLEKEYAFGVAVFDNAQVRHAHSLSVLSLAFE
jgi:hypothetical protein